MFPLEQQIIKELDKVDKQIAITKARKNINNFAEYILHDEDTGDSIVKADIHRTWHDHIKECRRRN